jgi:hypothetical protein
MVSPRLPSRATWRSQTSSRFTTCVSPSAIGRSATGIAAAMVSSRAPFSVAKMRRGPVGAGTGLAAAGGCGAAGATPAVPTAWAVPARGCIAWGVTAGGGAREAPRPISSGNRPPGAVHRPTTKPPPAVTARTRSNSVRRPPPPEERPSRELGGASRDRLTMGTPGARALYPGTRGEPALFQGRTGLRRAGQV